MCRNWDLFQELLVKLMFINKKFTLEEKREAARAFLPTPRAQTYLRTLFSFIENKFSIHQLNFQLNVEGARAKCCLFLLPSPCAVKNRRKVIEFSERRLAGGGYIFSVD